MSNTNYFTTSSNPNKYYWAEIEKSLVAITGKNQQLKEDQVILYTRLLQQEAEKKGVSLNHKEMQAELCLRACKTVLLEAVLTFGKPFDVAYALEYFKYAENLFELEKPNEVNYDFNTYYNTLLRSLINTIATDTNTKLLNSGDIVMDISYLRRTLKSIIDNFYNQHPELQDSYNHCPELQRGVNKVFSTAANQFVEVRRQNKTTVKYSY